MFDKVVLCKQGSSILNQVRSRTLSLEEVTVKVLLLGGDKIASNWNSIEVASDGTALSVSLKGTETETEIPSYVISSFFSCLSELHVVARCKDTDKPSFAQCHGVLVAVNNQAIILAVSDENIVVNDKLFMTFDVEETNNVLTAKADFDGVITQGILEERLKKLGSASRKDYSDNVLEENGGGKLPTNDAIKTYVKDGALHIVKGSDGSNQTNTGLGQDAGVFTANQSGDTTFYLGLGAAADKGIVTTITKDASDADVPTTKAVSEFVDGVVGTGKLSLTKNGTTVEFSANEADNSSKSMSFGTASDKDYEGVITVDEQSHKASDNLPTSQAVNAFVGKGILSISKKGVNNTQSETFSANSSSDVNIILGLGDAADKGVATSFTSKNASDADVPTTSAVSNFVSGAIGTANLNITVGGNTVTTFNANQSGDVDVTLDLGTAAKSTVASSVDASNSPNDLPTNSAVDAFVGKGTLTVHIEGTPADVVFSANEVTDSQKRVSFGNASQATTASSVSVTNATEQAKLPTNSAVDAFVGKGTLTIRKTDPDTTGTESFGANELENKVIGLGLGTAADANVCTEIHQEYQQGTTTELNNAQLSSLVTLEQARQIADESTSSSKSVSPADAANDNGVMVEKGAMVWLAVNFVGDVGICDFSTVAQNNITPVWSDSTDNKSTVAYIAKLNDNAGDFYATTKKIVAGHKFRTLNAMDVSGMADPSYGFALCLCIESKE